MQHCCSRVRSFRFASYKINKGQSFKLQVFDELECNVNKPEQNVPPGILLEAMLLIKTQ